MSDNTSSPLRRLTDAARQTHPEAPEDAAQMLCGGLALLPGEPGDLEFFVGAAQHVMLGHLDDAVALRDALTHSTGCSLLLKAIRSRCSVPAVSWPL